MSIFGAHRISPSTAATSSGGVGPRKRRLTAVLAVALAITASGFSSTLMAKAAPVGVPTGQSGLVKPFGNNDYDQGDVPAGLTDVTAIAGGGMHSLALKANGAVIAWGYNIYGQATVPAGLTGVTAISAGGFHSFALKADGTVVGWGGNDDGQTTVPAGLTGVTAISAGGRHTIALKSDSTVVAWGENTFGQTMVPVGLTGVTAISAGSWHSLALKGDGTVVSWGNDTYGQSDVPVGLTGVTAISAGGDQSLALKSDGTVVAWGGNDYGQTTVPVGLSGVTSIATGYYDSFALKSDGTAVGWGYNNNGQATVPVGQTGVLAIAGGVLHSLVLVLPSLPSPPVFTADSPPASVEAGVPLSYTFAASASPAATFAVSAGELPDGLSLAADGVLSGTTTVAGSSTFTVTASNGNLPDTAGASHAIEVTAGPIEAVNVAPQSFGSTTYTATAGAAELFASTGEDQWGNPLTAQTAILTTDHTTGPHPDAVSGSSIIFYSAGEHLVTTTIGGVSATVSVTTVPDIAITAAIKSNTLQVPLGGSVNLTMHGLDSYGNLLDLTSQAVFTSDWAVDVISGTVATFPHASPHVITGRVGALSSSVTIEVIPPTVAASTAAAGSASALAFTGSSPLPAVFGGAGALLVGLLVCGAAWSHRRGSQRARF